MDRPTDRLTDPPAVAAAPPPPRKRVPFSGASNGRVFASSTPIAGVGRLDAAWCRIKSQASPTFCVSSAGPAADLRCLRAHRACLRKDRFRNGDKIHSALLTLPAAEDAAARPRESASGVVPPHLHRRQTSRSVAVASAAGTICSAPKPNET